MLVAELRERLLDRVAQAASVEDQESLATTLEYARAALIALAQYPSDNEFVLQDAAVDTRTAALILRLHPEHVRYLIRSDRIPATKENGEYRIGLPSVADFLVSDGVLESTLPRTLWIRELLEGKGSSLWQQPKEDSS
jgi:hypothetical protein